MKKLTSVHILTPLTTIVFVAALVLTWQSIRITPQDIAHLQRKQADHHQLLSIEEQHRRDLATVQAYEQLDATTKKSLSALLSESFSGYKIEIHPRSETPVLNDWLLKNVDVTLDEIPLAMLAAFLKRAEDARPPWRATEYNISASDRQYGYGRVNLLMETIERK